MEGDSPNRETFGPLVDITSESIIRLATSIAELHLPVTNSGGGRIESRKFGSYNIVYVVSIIGTTKIGVENPRLVIRIPATGWGPSMTPIARESMESQAATMRFIRENTGLPISSIYAIDTTGCNEIGAPYICMSFLPGRPVSDIWFSHDSLQQEELRLKILTSLSKTMAELAPLQFKSMGSFKGGQLQEHSSTITIGCLYHWDEKDDESIQVTASGPYQNMSAYLEDRLTRSNHDNVWARAEAKIFDILLNCFLLIDEKSDSQMVLCHPDFDSQNILVDCQGTVTGLIDWDLVHTLPKYLGFARYPAWITRDWDPLMYGWPKMTESEDSPESLERYRQHYNTELGRALKSGSDWKYTRSSHLTEAIWIAANSSRNRLEICRKFVDAAISSANGEKADALDILYQIGMNEYPENEWTILKDRLRSLICFE